MAPRGQHILNASQALPCDLRLVNIVAHLNFLLFPLSHGRPTVDLTDTERMLKCCDLRVHEVQLFQKQGLIRILLQRLDYDVLPINTNTYGKVTASKGDLTFPQTRSKEKPLVGCRPCEWSYRNRCAPGVPSSRGQPSSQAVFLGSIAS